MLNVSSYGWAKFLAAACLQLNYHPFTFQLCHRSGNLCVKKILLCLNFVVDDHSH